MLVLTRLLDESLVLDSEITVTVTVLAINGSQVRLGIDAPKHIRVLREELVEQDPPLADEQQAKRNRRHAESMARSSPGH